MAIPSKGSRRIVVDDTAYRWTVRRKPTYAQGLADSPLSFAVENEAAPGTTLLVLTDGPRADNWVEPPGRPVTPAIVEQAIRAALAQGWQSSDQGGAFEISLAIN
jgi:hypothetical protein